MDGDDDYPDYEELYAGLDDAPAAMEPSHFARITILGFVASIGLMAFLKTLLVFV